MPYRFFLLLLAVGSFFHFQNADAQEKTYKIGCVGFYNFENLFDTLDNPITKDEEFTPSGEKLYNSKIYNEKLDNLAKVVSEVGIKQTPDGVAVLGVSEIENRLVLEDFVKNERIADRNYQIVHYDSEDFRGIDVALLYNPKYFEEEKSRIIPVMLYDDKGERKFTRDVLVVEGSFDGENMHFLVNHWPSRRGGEKATAPYRNAAADVCKAYADSVMKVNADAKIFIMGDLNDDPISGSVAKHLRAEGKKEKVKKGGLFNPMYGMYKKGQGTLAYRDAWSLFDQIILSEGALSDDDGYFFYRAEIFKERYLQQKTGRYKGYPMRTYSWGEYIGGYSDHFPVCVYLLKATN